MALFNAIAIVFGGMIAPYIFGSLLELKDASLISLGYYIASFLMLIAGAVSWFLNISVE